MWRCGQAFEWGNHYGLARSAGVTREEVLAIRTPDPDRDLDGPVAVVVRAADEVVDAGYLSEATMAALPAVFPDRNLQQEFLYLVAGLPHVRHRVGVAPRAVPRRTSPVAARRRRAAGGVGARQSRRSITPASSRMRVGREVLLGHPHAEVRGASSIGCPVFASARLRGATARPQRGEVAVEDEAAGVRLVDGGVPCLEVCVGVGVEGCELRVAEGCALAGKRGERVDRVRAGVRAGGGQEVGDADPAGWRCRWSVDPGRPRAPPG